MNSLEEYALFNGEGRPAEAAPPPASYEDMKEHQEHLGQLKENIIYQLKQGNEPESILFTALQALSLATNDRDFFEQGASFLNGDKEEQSFFPDLEQMEADRDARRLKYWQRQEGAIRRQLREIERDREALAKALEQIPALSLPAKARKVWELRQQGLGNVEICKQVGLTLGQLQGIAAELERQGIE